MGSFFRIVLLAAASFMTLPLAMAADALTEAVQNSYPPYRAALFKTSSKSQAESRESLRQARDAWARVVVPLGAKPPAPYDRDMQLATTIAAVDKAYTQAAAEIEQDKLEQAHETLEEVRGLLAEMRKRNNVVVFSDHMNAYHSAMEHVLKDGSKMLAEPNGVLQLMASVGVLDYLARRLGSDSPPVLSSNAEFLDLTKAVAASVDALKGALLAGNMEGVKTSLGALKKSYARLFIKFG